MSNEIAKPIISIIIRAKNEERFISQTLKAVFEQKIALPFEVIVIDSGSTDRTLEIAHQFKIRLFEIPSDRFTYGHALNYGVGLAESEYIINLSAHCIPADSGWMANLLNPLLSDPSIAATFGRQQPIKGLNPFEEQLLIADFCPDEEGKIKPVFSNSNCAIRKKVWERYPFDEKTLWAEDIIWAKMLPSEYKIKYVHCASVHHSHHLTLKYWARRYHDSGMSERYLEQVYGLEWPWKASSDKGKNGIIRRVLTNLISYASEFLYITLFLIRNRYYRHIPILPVFLILRRHYYYKGIEEGIRVYGDSTGYSNE